MNENLVEFQVVASTPKTRFLASLSDGRTVIQDERPNAKNAWIRLKKFIETNPGLSITGLRLQGPGGREYPMPPNQKGYFFGKKARKTFPGGQATYVGVGYYDGNVVTIQWHRENFSDSFTEDRTRQKAGFFLIENP